MDYKKLPGCAGIEGILYQIHVLTMVLLNGLQIVENWRLSTENKAGAQFDDLVFEYLASESTILLQAKHKDDEKKEVAYKDLISVGNKNLEFSLPKYFFSYQEVRKRFKVGNVVICTNLKLNEKVKNIKGVKKENIEADSVLHFEGGENICYGFSGCSFPELKQNIMSYYAKNIKKKKVIVSDEAISDFLNHLKFFPNCLSDKNVKNIVRQTLVKFSEKLNVKMVQKDIHQKMTDWFKEKRGRYLTKVEAKAFFYDIRSNKYCEDLTRLYDIRFKRKNLPLIFQTQTSNQKQGKKSRQQNASNAPVADPKRISHIIPDKEYTLNVVKIYQALPTHHKEKALFVNPDETVGVKKAIIDAFEVQHYTILVMVCPHTIEETAAGKMCDRMVEILNTYKYKHVILIAEETDSLATQLNACINSYEVITDNITFADLEDTTQGEFKRKKLINFQGCTMSLEELFPPSTEEDLNQIVDSEMISKLAQGHTSKVGLELPRLDNYYISRNFNCKGQIICEKDLWRSTEVSGEKVILISDSAGMGKSSVLTSLAISLKIDNPHLWVVRFDLNNYTNVMGKMRYGLKKGSIVEMLNSLKMSKLESEFDKKLFATQKRVVLMLDGVDEVSPTFTELVINLIRDSLAEVNLAKIYVTARPHMSRDFRKISELQSLSVAPFSKDQGKSFTLEPFSKVDQKVFLIKYWTESLDLQGDVKKSKCSIYAEALIENIARWINENDRNSIAGIPLQTRMLAEIFQDENQMNNVEHDWEGCREFLLSRKVKPNLPTRIDLILLYKLFIDKKCDIFIKKSNPRGSVRADELLKNELEKCKKFHRSLAFKLIFGSNEMFTSITNVKRPISKSISFLFDIGIVQGQKGNIEFVHRTFAEYFVTEYLLTELERQPINEAFHRFFMESIMKDEEFSVIRAFLNSRMPSVLQNSFHSYFQRNRISEKSVSLYLEVFAEGGHARILECFVKYIEKEHFEIFSRTISQMALMYNTLYFAIEYGHRNILKLLLELNEMFNSISAHRKFLRWTIMHAFEFNLEIFKFLLCQVDKNGTNILRRSALHEAAFMCRLEEVESLMERSGEDINIKDHFFGWTALHEATFMGRFEVVKFLVEKGADVNVTDNDGETALHRTAYCGRLEAVKFLVEIGADINVKNNKGITALRMAAFIHRFNIVKFLVTEAKTDINATDNGGETVLHRAAYVGDLVLVKFLVNETGAHVNAADVSGETALHKAAYRGNLEIVKFLVKETGADINVKNNESETVLHKAAFMWRSDVVKFLVEEAEVDINATDNDGETVLHKAALKGDLTVVKFLVEEMKANKSIEHNQGRTALWLAADQHCWSVAKFLSN